MKGVCVCEYICLSLQVPYYSNSIIILLEKRNGEMRIVHTIVQNSIDLVITQSIW